MRSDFLWKLFRLHFGGGVSLKTDLYYVVIMKSNKMMTEKRKSIISILFVHWNERSDPFELVTHWKSVTCNLFHFIFFCLPPPSRPFRFFFELPDELFELLLSLLFQRINILYFLCLFSLCTVRFFLSYLFCRFSTFSPRKQIQF